MADRIQPDVVLLDLALPGMSGYDVARHLTRARTGYTPLIIAISGYAYEHTRKYAEDTGIDFHMVKPINPDELQATLERYHSLRYGAVAVPA